MAPKKKVAAGKAKSKNIDSPSAPSMSTRATGRAAPETVTTKRGKTYDTTAAATRPTRGTARTGLSSPDTTQLHTRSAHVPSKVKNAVNKRTAPAPSAQPSRKRGRPAKVVKRRPGRPGRPAKGTTVSTPASTSLVTAARRGPGRPRKATHATAATTAPAPKARSAPKTTAAGKKRGRPAKETVQDQPPKKRGRPSRTSALADAVPPQDDQPTPRKRGRPPYGGETTKIDTDDEAAADQLEEELMNGADEETTLVVAPIKRVRGRPGGKGKQAAATPVVVDDATSSSGQQYWIMKAEQDGHDEKLPNGEIFNTKFTIDDLRAKGAPEPWDGVRSPAAAKNMRAMRVGDLAFFYASGGKTPGIVGMMEVVGEAQPDVTTSDQNSHGYVENESQRSKWCVVHVEFRKKFKRPIPRTQLVAARDAGPLASLQEFKVPRLSVSKVTKDEWDYISSFIDDFDDEEEPFSKGKGRANIETDNLLEQDVDLPSLPAVVPTAIMSVEQHEMPTTDSIFPPGNVTQTSGPIAPVSSRPTSRGSYADSAAPNLTAGSSHRGSRAESRAPSASRNLAPPSVSVGSKSSQTPSGLPSSGGLMEAIGEE